MYTNGVYSYTCIANICALATRLNRRPLPGTGRTFPHPSRALCFCSILRAAPLLALPCSHPYGVGLLINPFVCPQVGIPESRGSMCAGSMPGHTSAYSAACKYGLLCMSVFGVWRNCIFLHRARFFSRRFARHSRETRNFIITPFPRTRRNFFYPRIIQARNLTLPFKGTVFHIPFNKTTVR